MRKVLSGMLLLSIVSGCSTTGAYLFPEMPPRADIKSGTTIAVDFFSGSHGERVASEIEKNLINKGFKVVDRRRLASQIQEKIITPSRYKNIPAKILISGHVNRYNFSEHTKSEVISCSSPERENYRGTNYILQGIGNVSATIRVIDLKTGGIIYTDTILARKKMENDRHDCGSSYYKVSHPDSEEVMSRTLEKFSKEFSEIISPYKTMIYVDLPKFDEDKLPELAEGHSWMQKSELVKASHSYKKAWDRAKKTKMPNEAIGHSLFAYGLSLSYQRNSKGLGLIDDAYKIYQDDQYLKEKSKVANIMNFSL